MRLHHIGVVVDNIERYGCEYAQMVGFTPQTAVFEDPIQKVKVQFWGAPDQLSVELVEPVGTESPAYNALRKGGGLNHLGFEVEHLDNSVRAAVANGAVCVCEAVPATAFDGRRIAFVFYRHIGLVELIESKVNGRCAD